MKWPEQTPIVKINKQSAVKFIKSIICRFGIPNRIITHNGSQFTSRVLQEYFEDLGVQICYASVAHPDSNGQVERANAEILRDLKTRTYNCLKKHGAKWIDELPCALWGNRTSSSRAMGATPFLLVYGGVVVIPPEITMVSLVSRHTMKLCRISSGVMMLTSSTNKDGKQLSKMHGTIRCSSAITTGLCIVGGSTWMV
jgi:transposase InsO family protein